MKKTKKNYRIYFRMTIDGLIDVEATNIAQAKKLVREMGTTLLMKCDWEIVKNNVCSEKELDKNDIE